MKSTCFAVCVVAAVAFSWMTHAESDEPINVPTPAAGPMRGKEPGEVRDDNGVKMKLVWCPSGKFTMGSPPSEQCRDSDENQVSVTLTNGFWLGKYEVTQSEWKQVMQTEPWKGQSTKQGADFPAGPVSWDDAMQFCRKLTEPERGAGRLPAGWEYTLPTEAQWEYACRAGTETRFSFGGDESKLGDYAWFSDNAWNAGEQYAHQVGQKKANPWGLHDMHGNAWEWCRDVYAAKLPGGRDPEVKSDETTKALLRVNRGGGWAVVAASCRSGLRIGSRPDNRSVFYGFRVALSSVR